MSGAKDIEQRDYFRNRLVKRDRHLRKWSKRNRSDCYRVYDRDIPEVPLAVDRYGDAAVLYLYERPFDKDPGEELAWLELMKEAAVEALGIDPAALVVRARRRLGIDEQYERGDAQGVCRTVREQGLQFEVKLGDYLDTGLFMDHRPARAFVRKLADGKRVLNLYCYTGSFSVYALDGNASSVTGVDLSNTYLSWAEDNIRLNGLPMERYRGVRADVQAFLASEKAAGERYDIIVLDPPTFSNSKMMEGFLDVNRHWPELVSACAELLDPEGFLLFSTNSRQLRFDESLLTGLVVRDISDASVPEDFRPRQHRAWLCFRSEKAASSVQFP